MSRVSPSPERGVGVVIPAYNCEGFVAEAIDSVYEQTIAPAEVIVVNDGSTDGTESLLRRLAGRLPKSFRWVTQDNGGSANARNAGIRLATAEFIAFLDHDDLWYPEKLARQLDQFAAEPELTLSFTGMTVAAYEHAPDGSLRPQSDGEGNQAPSAEPGSQPAASLIRKPLGVSNLFADWSSDPQVVLKQLLADPPMGSLSTVMIRRDAFDHIGGFDEQLRVSDDWLMWLQMAAAGMRFGHVPEVMVLYRNHESNLTRSRLAVWNDLCSMFDEFLATNELPSRIRRRIGLRKRIAWWHLITAIQELNAGHKGIARHHILRAARVHPLSIRPGWVRMFGIGPAPRYEPTASGREPTAMADPREHQRG
jgi:glycosyltransferase involved in cell wall biosynthesis